MPENEVDRVWELMNSITFCMFTNWNGTKMHSRPMGAFVRRAEGAIYFFTDEHAQKLDEIERHPKVCLTFANTGGQKYVSVSGTAEISADRDKIKELWAIPAKVWWKTPDNPNIRLIKVVPEEAEYWDTPGNFISGLKVAFALVKGTHPNHGREHRKIAL